MATVRNRITGFTPNRSQTVTVVNVSGETHASLRKLSRKMGVPMGHLSDALLTRAIKNIQSADVTRFKRARNQATQDFLGDVLP